MQYNKINMKNNHKNKIINKSNKINKKMIKKL